MVMGEEEKISHMVNEIILEDRLVELWPDYPCLYDIRCGEFNNRGLQQQAFEDLAKS